MIRVIAVLDDVVGKGERLKREVGVRHVGVVVLGSVADAAVVLVVGLALLADVPLLADEVLAGFDNVQFELVHAR